jgi:hypothetical protein
MQCTWCQHLAKTILVRTSDGKEIPACEQCTPFAPLPWESYNLRQPVSERKTAGGKQK